MSQAQFDKTVAIIQSLPDDGPVKTSQTDKLVFYKYFKQATVGDVNTSRPGMMDFVGKAKWDAWKSVEGISQEQAKAEYVKAFLDILAKTENEDSKKYTAEINALA